MNERRLKAVEEHVENQYDVLTKLIKCIELTKYQPYFIRWCNIDCYCFEIIKNRKRIVTAPIKKSEFDHLQQVLA
jgi:hypothetical protein